MSNLTSNQSEVLLYYLQYTTNMANEIEQLTSERNLLSQQKNQLIQENAKCIFIF